MDTNTKTNTHTHTHTHMKASNTATGIRTSTDSDTIAATVTMTTSSKPSSITTTNLTSISTSTNSNINNNNEDNEDKNKTKGVKRKLTQTPKSIEIQQQIPKRRKENSSISLATKEASSKADVTVPSLVPPVVPPVVPPPAIVIGGTTVSKRLSKQITKCGKHYKTALNKLFTAYPFLHFTIDDDDIDNKDNNNKDYNESVDNSDNGSVSVSVSVSISNSQRKEILKLKLLKDFDIIQLFDAFRPIGAMINIFAKVNQPLLGMKLLNQALLLIEIYEEGNPNDGDNSGDVNDNDNDNNIDHVTERKERQSRKISFLHLMYKSIIGMIGQTIPKQNQQEEGLSTSTSTTTSTSTSVPILSGEYILQLLYYDLPLQTQQPHHQHQHQHQPQHQPQQYQLTQEPPPIDLYHNTISALGKCRRMDLIMKMLHDMESNRVIQLDDGNNNDNNNNNNNNILLHPTENDNDQLEKAQSQSQSQRYLNYELPKPDQTTYATALTATIRSKAYNEAVQILQNMKQHKMYPNILAYNQVLSCISNSGSMFGVGSNERFRLTNQILNEMQVNYTDKNDDVDNNGDLVGDGKNGVIPTESTYKIVMAIYAKENRWDEVKKIKQRMMVDSPQQQNMNNNSSSTTGAGATDINANANTSVTTTINCRIRRGSVESRHGKEMTIDNSLSANESIVLQHMNDLKKLEKMAAKRHMWYKVGTYTALDKNDKNDISFSFGIQTHRNPSENGLSLVFHEEETNQKLGYMLIRNNVGQKQNSGNHDTKGKESEDGFVLHSSFMGMYIYEGQRGKKLAKKFMATWLLMCLKSDALPSTEIINKPLLSLVLTSFGFIPKDDDSGIEVEVCPISSVQDKPQDNNIAVGWYPDFAMYSTKVRPEDGTFGARELRVQKMMITKYPPIPRGKVTVVKTSFDHPLLHVIKSNNSESVSYDNTKNDLQGRIDRVLGGHGGKVTIFADNDLLRRVLFGFLY